MFSKQFPTQSHLVAYALERDLDFEQTRSDARIGEGLFTRYVFSKDGINVGYGVVYPPMAYEDAVA